MVTPARGAILAGALPRDEREALVLDVYAPDGRRVGRILDPWRVELVERRLAVSSATIVLGLDPAHEPYVGLLRQPGYRVHVTDGNGYVMGGPVVTRTVNRADATLTVGVEDYLRLFVRTLAWQVPGSPLSAQTREFYTDLGRPEGLVKAIASANFARLGLPVTVAPNLDRGGNRLLRITARMDRLSDVLLDALAARSLDLRIRPVGTPQQMTGLVFDVVEPPDYPVVITEASDVLADYALTDIEPQATRVVLGGGGEGVARDFYGRTDTAREATRGGTIAVGEVFVDARDLRSELDAATATADRAREDLDRADRAYKDAYVDERAVNARGRADVGDVDARETRNMLEARVNLAEARATGNAQTIATRQAEYDAAVAQRTQRINEADAQRDADNAAAATATGEAFAKRDRASTDLAVAQTNVTTETGRYATAVNQALSDALADGGPQVAAFITLAETGSFRWDGSAVQLGTRIRFSLDGVEVSERIRERRRTYTAAGVDSVPVLGERDASPDDRIVKIIAALARRVRAQSAR